MANVETLGCECFVTAFGYHVSSADHPRPWGRDSQEVAKMRIRSITFKVLYAVMAITALVMASGAPVNWGGG